MKVERDATSNRSSSPDDRTSIWSVPIGATTWFYGGFTVQVVGGAVILYWRLTQKPELGWGDGIIPFWQYLAPLAIVAVSSTIIAIHMYYFVRYAKGWLVEIASEWILRKIEEAFMTLKDYLDRKLKQQIERRDNTPYEVRSRPVDPNDPALNPPAQFNECLPPEATSVPNQPLDEEDK